MTALIFDFPLLSVVPGSGTLAACGPPMCSSGLPGIGPGWHTTCLLQSAVGPVEMTVAWSGEMCAGMAVTAMVLPSNILFSSSSDCEYEGVVGVLQLCRREGETHDEFRPFSLPICVVFG